MNFAEAIMKAYPMIEICGVELDPIEILKTMRPHDYEQLKAAWDNRDGPKLELVHTSPAPEINKKRSRPTLIIKRGGE